MSDEIIVGLERGKVFYLTLQYLNPADESTGIFSYTEFTEGEFQQSDFVEIRLISIIPKWVDVQVGLINHFPAQPELIANCTKAAISAIFDVYAGLSEVDNEEWLNSQV